MTDNAAPAAKLPQVLTGNAVNCFSTADSFALGQRMAQALANSDLVPDTFKDKVANCLVAVEMANRMGASVLMVMQNLNVIHGRPSWSSPFIIAALNSCGKFSPLRFKMEQLGEIVAEYEFWTGTKGNSADPRRKEKGKQKINNARCVAYAVEKATGEVLTGPSVTVEMAVKEGWYHRDGSKWQNMPDLMLTYRAAAFFGRIYASDVLMGMQTTEELKEIDVTPGSEANPIEAAAPAAPAGSTESLDKLNQDVKTRKPRAAKTPATAGQDGADATPAAGAADGTAAGGSPATGQQDGQAPAGEQQAAAGAADSTITGTPAADPAAGAAEQKKGLF